MQHGAQILREYKFCKRKFHIREDWHQYWNSLTALLSQNETQEVCEGFRNLTFPKYFLWYSPEKFCTVSCRAVGAAAASLMGCNRVWNPSCTLLVRQASTEQNLIYCFTELWCHRWIWGIKIVQGHPLNIR